MPYLIDGHNLIPHLGISLEAVDDELDLIKVLQAFSRRSRKAVEVYFDGAPPGRTGTRKYGQVTAHFVSQRSTADAAISSRLADLGKAARNWVIVSSDRAIRTAAAGAHAQVQTSEQFTRVLRAIVRAADAAASTPSRGEDGGMSEQELQHWLEVFRKR